MGIFVDVENVSSLKLLELRGASTLSVPCWNQPSLCTESKEQTTTYFSPQSYTPWTLAGLLGLLSYNMMSCKNFTLSAF